MLQLHLVDPRDDPTLIAEFYRGQAVAYAEFHAEQAARPILDEEIDQGCVCLVIARDEDSGELAGGLRLYLRPPGTRLPVERLLHQYPELIGQIESLSHRGVAEIGGCWAQRRWRGTGLSVAMFRMAIAAMPLLGVARGLAFSHHHVLPSWAPLGWTVDPSIARIKYPDARYETSVIWIDPLTLRRADHAQRAEMARLSQMIREGVVVYWSPNSELAIAAPNLVASAT